MKMTLLRPLATVALVSLMLAACSSAPKKNEMLEKARAEYKKVSTCEEVVKHAPEELDKARDALKKAESIWRTQGDVKSVEHYTYLANQRVQIANLIAESNEADRKLEDMKLERRNVTLDLREEELLKAKQDAEKLKQEMAALEAQNTERGMVLTLGDVLFDVGKTTMAPGARRNIDKIASFMKSHPDKEAIIEGHTDSMGEASFNMDLSRDRAFAVRDALVAAGVKSTRLTPRGFGETLPVATNSNAQGRQENRRVEIIFPDVETAQ